MKNIFVLLFCVLLIFSCGGEVDITHKSPEEIILERSDEKMKKIVENYHKDLEELFVNSSSSLAQMKNEKKLRDNLFDKYSVKIGREYDIQNQILLDEKLKSSEVIEHAKLKRDYETQREKYINSILK